METIRITITIAGRSYPLNVPPAEEEVLRRTGKKIEMMIKDFETNFSVRDKQDALAMCALRLGTGAEAAAQQNEKTVRLVSERLKSLAELDIKSGE